MTSHRQKITTPLVKWRLIPVAGAGVGNSGQHCQLCNGDIPSLAPTLLPARCHSSLSRCGCPQGAEVAGGILSSPNQAGHHPKIGAKAGDTQGQGHQQMAMASHPMGQRRARLSALTRSLVFDEEELQPLLEGVFIHVELDLHPAGRVPRGAVSGVAGQSRNPCPH